MTILRRTLAAVCALLPLVVLTPIDSTAQQEEAAEDTAVERVEPRGGDLPLETERTISFSTSEGSWISVDVSPDGGTIVFDLLGDIYAMPITGGSPTLVAGGLAFEAQPRFSPDGESIVYISDRSGGQNVWIMSLDGSDTTQVTTGKNNLYTSPEWTPDGQYIVVSRTYSPLGGEAKLRLYHVDGGSGAALIDGPEDLKTLGAAFGSDPRYIWFAQRSGDWEYNTTLPDYQVAVYDRETGSRTSMTSRYGSGFRPALSPDGRWLAYGSRHEDETGLRLRDLDSGEERWLAYPIQHDDQESRATLDALPGYSFTPDSREIVISYGGEIWRVPVDGSEPEEIPFTVDIALDIGAELDFEYRVDDAATFDVRQIRDAVPSPDGSRLAFTALDRLYVMDWPDGAPRRLTGLDTGEYQPTWSPDGSSIAFVTWSDAEGGHIYRASAAGGQARPLTETAAYYGQPAWSPDGERIVAVRAAARSRREGGGRMGAELVWVPANGGEVSTIAPAAGRGSPHFTTDPDRIYTYSGSDGLVSMRWDGTDERTHLRVTGATPAGGSRPRPASTILMAPRGDRALAEVENELYVVTVPYVGGETPSLSVTRPENAAFPMRRLTDIGGDFPAWGSDGRTIHWSIGNAHLVYDLDRAEAVEDSVDAAERAMLGDAEEQQPDTAAAENGAPGDEDDAYDPAERRIRVEAPRDVPSGVVVLRGARAITMNGDEIIEDADILVRDNRIAAIGARGSVEIPADADTIDLEGQTVVPGFIDTHAHLRPDRDIHTDQPWQYLANLAYGVTTTRDPQTGTTDVLSYSDRVRTGDIVGPRVYSTGPGIFGSYQGTGIRDLDHARSILRRYSDYYDTKTFKMYLAGNREQRQWLIMAAEELGLMPTTEAGLDFALDLTHAIDGYPGIEHNLPIYPLYDDVVQLFAQSGVTNTPTLIVSFGGPMGENWFFSTEDVHDEPRLNQFTPHTVLDALTRRRGSNWFMRDEYVFDDHARFLADLVEAGGRVGVGGHGQLQGLGWHWELWMVQSGGMSEHDALRAATLHGAAAIGLERDLGSLEAGKLADLVVLDGDPLTDIRNSDMVSLVMKNGRLYEADSLSEIWPRQGEAPGFWSEEEPVTAAGMR